MTAASPEVPARLTSAGLSREAWTATRHAAAFDTVRAPGLDDVQAWSIATALVGHWAIECGWGRAEWRWNVGNIKPGNRWTGPVQRLADGLVYRAYGSLAEGVGDAVRLASGGRYADAWRYLLASRDGLGWYDRLMRAGWHPWSEEALATYRSTSARVAAVVGAAPPSSSSRGPALVAAAAVGVAFYALARSARR